MGWGDLPRGSSQEMEMEGVSWEGEWGDTGQEWPRVKPRGIAKVWGRVGGYGWNTQDLGVCTVPHVPTQVWAFFCRGWKVRAGTAGFPLYGGALLARRGAEAGGKNWKEKDSFSRTSCGLTGISG